jgi:MFS family permease
MIKMRIATLLAAAALAVTTSALAPQAEAHWRRGHYGWYGGGVAFGILGAALVASALAHRHRHRHYYYSYGPYYGYGYRPYYRHRHYYYGHRHHHRWHRHW